MGNGLPVAGVIAKPDILAVFSKASGYFNTFGSSPVAAAAGIAVLEVIEREGLMANATAVGAYLCDRLRVLAARHGRISDVRGAGLYIGVEFRDAAGQPDVPMAQHVVNDLRRQRVLIGTSGTGHILKIRPPLCFAVEHADLLLAALERALKPEASQHSRGPLGANAAAPGHPTSCCLPGFLPHSRPINCSINQSIELPGSRLASQPLSWWNRIMGVAAMRVRKSGQDDRHTDARTEHDRRSFLTSACKASLGLAAASGLLGAFAKPSLAAGTVTKMGFDHPFSFVTYVSDIQRWGTTYAKAHGLTALYTSDNGKLDAQIANLETWISQGVKAICCFPMEPTAIEKIAAKARAKGITWVSYAAHLKNQDSSVLFGNTESGTLVATAAADFINKVHGGKCEILRLNFPEGGELARERDKAVDDTLAKLVPNSTVVATQRSIDAASGLQITNSVLAASHPNVKVVIGINDDGALGAYRAFLDRGHDANDPEIFICGQDGAQQALALIKKGTMYRACSALAVRDLAAAVVQHPIDVANGGSKEDAVVPVKLLMHGDTALLDDYLAQLSPG